MKQHATFRFIFRWFTTVTLEDCSLDWAALETHLFCFSNTFLRLPVGGLFICQLTFRPVGLLETLNLCYFVMPDTVVLALTFKRFIISAHMPTPLSPIQAASCHEDPEDLPLLELTPSASPGPSALQSSSTFIVFGLTSSNKSIYLFYISLWMSTAPKSPGVVCNWSVGLCVSHSHCMLSVVLHLGTLRKARAFLTTSLTQGLNHHVRSTQGFHALHDPTRADAGGAGWWWGRIAQYGGRNLLFLLLFVHLHEPQIMEALLGLHSQWSS